jgi:RNA polymerase sigma factor (sigma-70 family)
MAQSGLVIHDLHKWMEDQTARNLPDGNLLERFVTFHDEAAFTALVQRYGPLVKQVTGRVLHQREDIEDVCQATFLLLARKASAIRRQSSVSCWLYGVAYRLALRVKSRSRRPLPPHREISRSREPGLEAAGREFCEILDDEFRRLPAQFQAPLLLCGLEGKTRDEAAKQLGWSLGTFKRRLEQGRERLRRRLERRGLMASGVLCASLVMPDPVHADFSASSLGQLSRIVLSAANGSSPEALSLQATALARNLLWTSALAKMKLGLLILLGSGVIVACAVAFNSQRPTAHGKGQSTLIQGAVPQAALEQALATKRPSLEVRQRTQTLLEKLRVQTPDRLRVRRLVEFLEHSASSEARQLLAGYACGTSSGFLGRESQTALQRLNGR